MLPPCETPTPGADSLTLVAALVATPLFLRLSEIKELTGKEDRGTQSPEVVEPPSLPRSPSVAAVESAPPRKPASPKQPSPHHPSRQRSVTAENLLGSCPNGTTGPRPCSSFDASVFLTTSMKVHFIAGPLLWHWRAEQPALSDRAMGACIR
jgi:hypothetical protein